MNALKNRILLVSLILLAASHASAVIISTDWQTSNTSTVQGDLAGITVDVTNVGSAGSAPAILFYDMSTADFAPYQLAASQESLDYGFDENWIASFSSPVTNLMLYCKFWRGPNNGGADPANFEYEFDTPFIILSGFSNSSIVGNTLIVPSSIFQDGILLFTGPLSSIGLLSNNANSGSRQGLTFGLDEDTVATENSSWGNVKSLYR